MNSSILPVTIPARRGKATHLAKGQTVKVINIYGHQVVDTWAFNAANLKVCRWNISAPALAV